MENERAGRHWFQTWKAGGFWGKSGKRFSAEDKVTVEEDFVADDPCPGDCSPLQKLPSGNFASILIVFIVFAHNNLLSIFLFFPTSLLILRLPPERSQGESASERSFDHNAVFRYGRILFTRLW
jgi:hypothetical protein